MVRSAVARAHPPRAMAMVLRRPISSIPARATNRAGSSPALVMRMFLKSSEVSPMAGGGKSRGGRDRVNGWKSVGEGGIWL